MLGSGKGGWYMIEVLIVVFVILTSFVIYFNKPRNSPEFSIMITKHVGFWALRSLDEKGLLRIYVENNDVSSIKDAIDLGNILYDVSICRTTCTSVDVPKNESVMVISYYIYGFKDMNPAEVRLYMWSE